VAIKPHAIDVPLLESRVQLVFVPATTVYYCGPQQAMRLAVNPPFSLATMPLNRWPICAVLQAIGQSPKFGSTVIHSAHRNHFTFHSEVLYKQEFRNTSFRSVTMTKQKDGAIA